MLEQPVEGQKGLRALTPKEIDAYLDLTKAEDFLMDRLNDFRLSLGESPLPPRPGYMPHTWQEPFRIKVTATEKLPEGAIGPPRQLTAAVLQANSVWEAKRKAQIVNSGKHDDAKWQYTVEKDNDTGKLYTVKVRNVPE